MINKKRNLLIGSICLFLGIIGIVVLIISEMTYHGGYLPTPLEAHKYREQFADHISDPIENIEIKKLYGVVEVGNEAFVLYMSNLNMVGIGRCEYNSKKNGWREYTCSWYSDFSSFAWDESESFSYLNNIVSLFNLENGMDIYVDGKKADVFRFDVEDTDGTIYNVEFWYAKGITSDNPVVEFRDSVVE